MKRVIAFALMILMVLSCFVGCKKDEDGEGENTTVATTTTGAGGDGPLDDETTRQNAQSSLPSLNYDGMIIRYLTRDREDVSFEIIPEMISDDNLSQALYLRNLAVEETLGVDLQIIQEAGSWSDASQYMDAIRNNANGPDYFDIVSGPNYSLIPLALEGYFRNIHSLDYIDTEKPWWNRNFIEECTYNDKLFTIEGELSLSMIDSAFVMFFNKKTFESNHPNDNLYDIVSNGKWTFDVFKTYIENTWDDIGAVTGSPDSGDSFGYVSPSFSCGRDGYPAAFGATVASRDGNGNIVYTFDDPTNFDKWGVFYDFLDTYSGTFVPEGMDGAREETKAMFEGGRAMFITELLHYAFTLRQTGVEYGCVPLPKYNSDQTSYGTSSEAVHSQFAIPRAGSQNEEASAVLELLCFQTYKDVTLTYFNSTLKAKNMGDPESTYMLDIVVDSITCDFGAYYSAQLTWPFPVIGTESDLGSYLGSKRKMMQPKLDSLISSLNTLDD